MIIKETISLIADSADKSFDRTAFAKEAGIKSDSVGWMNIDIRKDYAKLTDISRRAGQEGVKLTGVYKKKAYTEDAVWYRLAPQKHFSMSDYSYAQKIDDYYYYQIKAYKAPRGCTMIDNYVSQKFVDVYTQYNFTGLDYIWAPDNGKYRADTFYKPICLNKAENFIYPGRLDILKKITYDRNTMQNIEPVEDYNNLCLRYKAVDCTDGNLCRIEPYIDNLEVVPAMALDYDTMPQTHFAYCYINGYAVIPLIRKEALDKMVAACAADINDFEPVPPVDMQQKMLIQAGEEYKEFQTELNLKEHFEELRIKLMEKERPEFIPTEKEVAALFRKNKKAYPEYYGKAVSKNAAQQIEQSRYAAMLTFYKIAGYARLAEDTYEYYPYEEAVRLNDKWHNEHTGSEYRIFDNAVLIGRSAEDNELLLDGESVLEVSCHTGEIIRKWEKAYLFIYENVSG